MYHPDANLALYSPVVQPLSQEAFASTSYGSLSKDKPVAQTMVGNLDNGKSRLKQPNSILKKRVRVAVQKVWCELCKVECPDVQLYAKHISGKLHNKNLRKLYAPAIQASQSINKTCSSAEQASLPGLTHVPLDLESKKQKLLESGADVQSLRVCTICDVACNSEVAYADHLAGKKHIAQERATSNPVVVHIRAETQEITAKKTENIGCVWCEVCKISCTSDDGLTVHKQGKRHKKNVEKLSNPIQPCGALENAESQHMHTASCLWCEICKISCTSSDGLTIHKQGKKHKKNVEKLEVQTPLCKDLQIIESEQQQQQQQYVESKQVMGIIGVQPNESDDVETNEKNVEKLSNPIQPVENAESQQLMHMGNCLWCEICKISCTSKDELTIHKQGKKHKKNIEKLEVQTPLCNDPQSIEQEQQLDVELKQVMEITGVQPKESGDVEANKRKLLENGTAENDVKTCTLCNVVCNSDIVFKFHLEGSKHRRMMKQAEGKMAA